MSIIQTERPEPTTQQKQQMIAQRIQREATQLFTSMTRTYQTIAQLVFANQQGLTPQQVLDAVGPSGAELLTLAGVLVQTVNTAVPDTLPTTFPFELNINQDGTVTVGEPV